MRNTCRAFTVLLVSLLLVESIAPLAILNTGSQLVYNPETDGHHLAATNLTVVVRVLNHLQAFDDDDFQFTVYYNNTYQAGNANVTLYFINGTKYLSKLTLGDGRTVFYNVPIGTYNYTVIWPGAPSVVRTGTIVSNGPEAFPTVTIGNLDRDNDNDDLRATVYDVENNPANGLNFSIHYMSNNMIWNQTVLGINGTASFDDIPIGVYIWRVTVMSGAYAGTVLNNDTFIADGTLKEAKNYISPFTGDAHYYDLEVFTYYETTYEPIPGVLVNVTYYNGTQIDAKFTPANGTVLFKDLPIAFINWTVTLGGSPIGLGKYSYNLTSQSADVRPPVITSPGDQEFLHGTPNITISWQVYDEYPKELNVYVNDVRKKVMTWSTREYTMIFNMTGYGVGTYNVMLKAIDNNNRISEDTIRVKIYENVTPVIAGPGNVSFYFSETGRSLRWNVSDQYLHMYSLTRNGTLIANGSLSGALPYVVASLDGLSSGIYIYRLTVNDTSGNEAYNEVYVTVLPDTTPPEIVYAPGTVFYNKGDRSVIRNWTVVEQFKSRYTIAVDGLTVVDTEWTSETISFDFSGLAEGQHIVRFTVYDKSGNSVESNVTVIVGPPFAVISGATVTAIVAVCIVIFFVWRMRFSTGSSV